MCDCGDKVILQETDGKNIASEYWCPEHGYQTSCYICNMKYDVTESWTTEVCIKHKNEYR